MEDERTALRAELETLTKRFDETTEELRVARAQVEGMRATYEAQIAELREEVADERAVAAEVAGVKRAFGALRNFWLTTRADLLALYIPAVTKRLECPPERDYAREAAYELVHDELEKLAVRRIQMDGSGGVAMYCADVDSLGTSLMAATDGLRAARAIGEGEEP